MHGDEPSATPALLDIADVLLSRRREPEAAAILEGLTLLMIPMLNPDGSEVYERRNSQAIDINRDALSLTTPEGRLLKRIRDEHQPMLGFNLHDQSRRMGVGDSGVLATVALLAVAGDPARTPTPGRLRCERACAAIVGALTPFAPGGIARFDEDWNPRAFGDNLTAWGTPVVLIESGGPPPGGDLEDLTRLNFVAILTVLRELARNDLEDHDPGVYAALPRNRRDAWADVIVRGGLIRQPGFEDPYRADLAFNREVGDRDAVGCGTGAARGSLVVEIGDTRFLGAARIVDAGDSLLVAPFAAGVEGWSARRWINGAVLEDLARLGVGTVHWQVPRRKIEAARSLARTFADEGRARIEVVSQGAEMPWLRLTGAPGRPQSDALSDVVDALVGNRDDDGLSSAEIVELLSWVPSSDRNWPSLRRGRPASFVLLAPVIEGRLPRGNGDVRVLSVFIDGVEVRGGAQ
jgi:hypothetical protein